MSTLSYSNQYQRKLFNYLLDYHPYMQDDKQDMIDFIVMRADNASKAYMQASHEEKTALNVERRHTAFYSQGLSFRPLPI